MNQVSERGAMLSSFPGVLVQEQVFQEGGGKIAFLIFCSGGCWWMLLLDSKQGGGKKTIKPRFFCHPLLERRQREKRRERPEVKKTPPFLLCFLGLKNGQEVVPPFWAAKFRYFKSAKTRIFKAFPGKDVGTHFWGKGYV